MNCLYDQRDYRRPVKEQQQVDQAAKNDPIKDGFTRHEMVHTQPSELENMGEWERYGAMHDNKDIERTR